MPARGLLAFRRLAAGFCFTAGSELTFSGFVEGFADAVGVAFDGAFFDGAFFDSAFDGAFFDSAFGGAFFDSAVLLRSMAMGCIC